MESMEWYQTHKTHGNNEFDSVPLIPFQPLQLSRPPIAPPTSLLCDHYTPEPRTQCLLLTG